MSSRALIAILGLVLVLPPWSSAFAQDAADDCGPGEELCGAECVDLRNEDSDCGACDRRCASGEHCEGGRCLPDASADTTSSDKQGVQPTDDTGASCPKGMEVTSYTDGHCCWPEQEWSRKRETCFGPPLCPTGMVVHGSECLELRTFFVKSRPPGAVLKVDGTTLGTTPFILNGLSPDARSYSLSLDGYESVTDAITAGTDDLRVDIALVPLGDKNAEESISPPPPAAESTLGNGPIIALSLGAGALLVSSPMVNASDTQGLGAVAFTAGGLALTSSMVMAELSDVDGEVPSRSGFVQVNLALGTGVGWANGEAEKCSESTACVGDSPDSFQGITPGIAPLPFHLLGEAMFDISPAIQVGAFVRAQFIEPATLFGVKARYFFVNSGRHRFHNGIGVGYGDAAFIVDLGPDFNNFRDIVRAEGPLHIAYNVGYDYAITEHFGLVFDFYLPLHLPDTTLHFDTSVGPMMRF